MRCSFGVHPHTRNKLRLLAGVMLSGAAGITCGNNATLREPQGVIVLQAGKSEIRHYTTLNQRCYAQLTPTMDSMPGQNSRLRYRFEIWELDDGEDLSEALQGSPDVVAEREESLTGEYEALPDDPIAPDRAVGGQLGEDKTFRVQAQPMIVVWTLTIRQVIPPPDSAAFSRYLADVRIELDPATAATVSAALVPPESETQGLAQDLLLTFGPDELSLDGVTWTDKLDVPIEELTPDGFSVRVPNIAGRTTVTATLSDSEGKTSTAVVNIDAPNVYEVAEPNGVPHAYFQISTFRCPQPGAPGGVTVSVLFPEDFGGDVLLFGERGDDLFFEVANQRQSGDAQIGTYTIPVTIYPEICQQ